MAARGWRAASWPRRPRGADGASARDRGACPPAAGAGAGAESGLTLGASARASAVSVRRSTRRGLSPSPGSGPPIVVFGSPWCPTQGTNQIRVEIHAKDTDENYLAVWQARETVENGLRLGAVGNLISTTVLRVAPRELGGVDLDLAVEDDVLPLDRADVPQQVGVEREVRRGGQP